MVAENLKDVKIGFIGAGNMAKAIGGGLIKNGIVDKSQIFVSAPSRQNFDWWNEVGATWIEKYDIPICCDIIFLAMKPQSLQAAISDFELLEITLAKRNGGKLPERLWVSILAGTTLNTLQAKINEIYSGSPRSRIEVAVIRIMPNTPMTVGQGCSVFCGNSHTTRTDLDRVLTMFSSLGRTFEVKEELIDSISSLIGNGPAYMYIIIEAMSDAGVKLGIPRDLAIQFAAQAMLGSAEMVLQTGRHPGVLKDEVCSPGGSTIAGLHVFEQRGVRAAIMDTLEAAAAKNKELGEIASGY